MPSYKPPKEFPGAGMLPQALQRLLSFDPQNPQVPTPVGTPIMSGVPLTSAKDIMTPMAQKTMNAMFKETNPIFKQMKAAGKFQNRYNTPVTTPVADMPTGQQPSAYIQQLKSLFGY